MALLLILSRAVFGKRCPEKSPLQQKNILLDTDYTVLSVGQVILFL